MLPLRPWERSSRVSHVAQSCGAVLGVGVGVGVGAGAGAGAGAAGRGRWCCKLLLR